VEAWKDVACAQVRVRSGLCPLALEDVEHLH
jgi:hypothetical protein